MPALASSSFLLATAGAPSASGLSADNPALIVAVCGILLSVFFAVDKVDAFIQRRRRNPPLESDLTALRASIDALNASVARIDAAHSEHNGHKEQIAELQRRCEQLDTKALNLEAQLARNAADQRSYTQRTTREIFERIEGVERTVSTNFQTVERGLGKVEGALELIVAQSKGGPS